MALLLASEYWAQIANGTKVEEYRICSAYYEARIGRVMEGVTAVTFHNRHGKHMTVQVMGVTRVPTHEVRNQRWVAEQRAYLTRRHGQMPDSAFVISLGHVGIEGQKTTSQPRTRGSRDVGPEGQEAARAILHGPLRQRLVPPVAYILVPNKQGVEQVLRELGCVPIHGKARIYKAGDRTFVKQSRSLAAFNNEQLAYSKAGNGCAACTTMRGAITVAYETGRRRQCTHYIATVALSGGKPSTEVHLTDCVEQLRQETGWVHGDVKQDHCIWCENRKRYCLIDLEDAEPQAPKGKGRMIVKKRKTQGTAKGDTRGGHPDGKRRTRSSHALPTGTGGAGSGNSKGMSTHEVLELPEAEAVVGTNTRPGSLWGDWGVCDCQGESQCGVCGFLGVAAQPRGGPGMGRRAPAGA